MKYLCAAMILVLLTTGYGFVSAESRNLIVRTRDGIQAVRSLDSVRKIIFSDNNLLLNYFSGTSETFPLISLSTLKFKQEVTGVSDLHSGEKAGTISVFPNPVDNMLFVCHAEGTAKAMVFRIDGTLVLDATLSSDTGQLFVGSLKPGLYILKVNNQALKFIKK